jgi:DNA end-binding protein Ku
VVEFVPTQQVDPILYGRSYYLEPDARAAKPYALLREALETTERVAVVKVALRQRESLAVLRVRDRVIMLQTLLWPDEVRAADFPILKEDVELRPQELRMAASLVDSMATDFEPDSFEDEYQKALFDLVDAKLEGAPPAPAQTTEEASTEVVDLLTALQASVDRARASRGEGSKTAERTTTKKAPAKTAAKAPTKKAPAKKTAAKSTAAKAPAKTAAKKTPARRSA